MARLYTSSLELGDYQSAGLLQSGGAITTDRPRTQSRSLKVTAGGEYGTFQFAGVSGRSYYARAYVNLSGFPSAFQAGVFEWGSSGGNWLNLGVRPDGGLGLDPSGGFTVRTTSGGLVALNTWHRVEMRVLVNTAANDECEVRLDGVTVLATELGEWSTTNLAQVDFGNHHSGNATMWFDDLGLNDNQGANQNSWPGAGAVYKLVPVSDPGTSSANWTKPGAATTNRHTSVDNVPPVYLADSTAAGDAEKMLRNAPSLANSALLLVTGTYTAAGIPAGDTIALVQAIALTGTNNATATAGDLGVSANPVVAQAAFASYGTIVASSDPTRWPRKEGTVSYLPSVTRGTGATIQVRKVTAATRVAMVNSVALLVEATPASTAWNPGTRADALGVTDSLSLLATYARTVADPVALTDVPLSVAEFNVQLVGDQLGVTDVPLSVVEFNVQLVGDQLGVTDGTVRDSGGGLTIPDLLGVTDAQAFVATYAAALADPLGLTDARGLLAVYARTVADPIGLTDGQTVAAVTQRSLADLLGVTDGRALLSGTQRTLADALGLTDGQALVAVTERTLVDLLGLTDAQAPALDVQSYVADLLELSDGRAFTAGSLRGLADLLGVADLSSTSLFVLVPNIYMLTPSGWVQLLTPEYDDSPDGWVRILTAS